MKLPVGGWKRVLGGLLKLDEVWNLGGGGLLWVLLGRTGLGRFWEGGEDDWPWFLGLKGFSVCFLGLFLTVTARALSKFKGGAAPLRRNS